MLSKIIGVGNKIELTRVNQVADRDTNNLTGENGKKVLVSQVYDILDEDRLKIAIPSESGKIVLLPNNTRIDACFYTTNGLYQGRFIIVDRYKEGNLLVQVVELINELTKYQRRQYFRLSCTMSIKYVPIDEKQFEEYSKEKNILEKIDEQEAFTAVALDISGGGMRFVSKSRHEKNSFIAVSLGIEYTQKIKKYGILAKIINVSTSKNNSVLYEHRVEFCNLDGNEREEIIKYIFDEERKRRKKESGQ